MKNLHLIYVEVFRKYSEKFAVSRRTFDKDWKKAKKRFRAYYEQVNKEKLKEAIKTEKKAIELKVLSKLESMKILSDIATGKELISNNMNHLPKCSDRIAAIKELAKINNWYAPKLTINSHSIGDFPNGIEINIVDDSGKVIDNV